MNVSFWISRRLRLRGNDGSSGAGVAIAVVGVALALMIMELTVGIVLGFKHGIRERLMGFDAQITVAAPASSYSTTLELTPALDSIVCSEFPDADIRLSLRQPSLLKSDTDFHGLVLLGQAPEGDFSFEKGNITAGVWPDFGADSCVNCIVLSEQVAQMLGVGVGDRITSSFFVDGGVKVRRHTVAGLYRSNFGEYDYNIAYASLAGLQKVAGMDSIGGNRLDIRGVGLEDLFDESSDLQKSLVDAVAEGKIADLYTVDNIMRSGALYFNWLDLLDTNVIVIFALMLAVAGLTLVSSLFILILERVRMIGVLRALGASKPTVRHIFVDMAMRLVGLGLLAGNVLGIGLLLAQKYTGAISLDPQMYYLDTVPVEMNIPAMIFLNVGVAVAAWLILVLPARVASSIDPATAISYQ